MSIVAEHFAFVVGGDYPVASVRQAGARTGTGKLERQISCKASSRSRAPDAKPNTPFPRTLPAWESHPHKVLVRPGTLVGGTRQSRVDQPCDEFAG